MIRELADFRFMSVLGRIGIGYTLSCIIYLYAGKKSRVIWFGGLLIVLLAYFKMYIGTRIPHGRFNGGRKLLHPMLTEAFFLENFPVVYMIPLDSSTILPPLPPLLRVY